MRAESRPRRAGMLLLSVLTVSPLPLANAGDSYRLDRASVDHAGGGLAVSNTYELVVAIGQHDAGEMSQSGTYRYAGGVFARVPTDVLFKNGFEAD